MSLASEKLQGVVRNEKLAGQSVSCEMSQPVILIHGGAWAVPDSLAEASRLGVKTAGLAGHRILVEGGSALDAVTQAVKTLEDDPAFDAGQN